METPDSRRRFRKLDVSVFSHAGRPDTAALHQLDVSCVQMDEVFFWCSESLQNTRRDGGSAAINADRQTTLDQRSPHNELGKHHSSHGHVSFFVWRLQSGFSAAVSLFRWKPHQRLSLDIAWIPANSSCDLQAAIGGDEPNGPLLFSTNVTAPDHQSDGLCVAWNISDSSNPSSCPRLPCLLGWHPRQKSHHPHDMVAPLA